MKLEEIETILTRQLSELDTGYYDAKLAVMLSTILTNGMTKYEEIDSERFPSEMNDRFTRFKEMYESKIQQFHRHLDEDSKIIKAIEASDSEAMDIEREISGLLERFDELIREKLDVRDSQPVGQL